MQVQSGLKTGRRDTAKRWKNIGEKEKNKEYRIEIGMWSLDGRYQKKKEIQNMYKGICTYTHIIIINIKHLIIFKTFVKNYSVFILTK